MCVFFFVLHHLNQMNGIATRSRGAQMNTCVVVIYVTTSSNGIIFICSALVHQIGMAIFFIMNEMFFSELRTV